MLDARCVWLVKDVAYRLTPPFSSNKVTSRKSKELWTKWPEWNNAAYEEKERYNYFTQPTPDHPHFNQKERMETWEKEETHTRGKKKQWKKNRRKVKRKQIN